MCVNSATTVSARASLFAVATVHLYLIPLPVPGTIKIYLYTQLDRDNWPLIPRSTFRGNNRAYIFWKNVLMFLTSDRSKCKNCRGQFTVGVRQFLRSGRARSSLRLDEHATQKERKIKTVTSRRNIICCCAAARPSLRNGRCAPYGEGLGYAAAMRVMRRRGRVWSLLRKRNAK